MTRVDDASRVAGGGSSSGFFLSCFGSRGARLEPEAVVAYLKDVAMVDKPGEQCGAHPGVAEHPGPLAEAEMPGDQKRLGNRHDFDPATASESFESASAT